MADYGVSTQNFLRLLLGGMQRGTDVFQNRQTMQQQQAPDLMLTLQQMMQRKQMADEELRRRDMEFRTGQANWEKSFEAQQEAARQARIRQGYQDFADAQAQMRQAYADKARLGLERERLNIAKGGAKSLEDYRASLAKQSEQAALAQERMALSTLHKSLSESPESFQEVNEKQFKAMYKQLVDRGLTPAQIAAEHGWTQTLGEDGKPLSFRRYHGAVANTLRGLEQRLKEIGGMPKGDAISEAAGEGHSLFGLPPGVGQYAPPTQSENTAPTPMTDYNVNDMATWMEEIAGT